MPRNILLIPLLLLTTIPGCQGSASNSSSDATDTRAQIKEERNYQVIRRNRAPFSVVLPAGGRIHVVHLADDRDNRVDKVILDTAVPTNAVITLSPSDGVRVNAVVKAPGPLQRNHTYEIRLIN